MADLGALLEKLGRNAGMAPSEIMQLRQKGRDLDAVGSVAGSWFRGGGQDPHFSYMSADQGMFGTMPNDIARVGTNTNQTIPNDTLTALAPADAVTGIDISRTHGIGVDVANGAIDLTNMGPDDMVFLFARVLWVTNTTGYRHVEFYDQVADAFLFSGDYSDANAAASGPVQKAFHSITNTYGTPRKIQLKVRHTAGAPLDVDLWRLDAIRVR